MTALEAYLCRQNDHGGRRWLQIALPEGDARAALDGLRVATGAVGWALARDGVLLAWNTDAPIAVGGLFEKVRHGAKHPAG